MHQIALKCQNDNSQKLLMEENTHIEDDEMIKREFEALLDDYQHTLHRQKIDLIRRAFEFANKAHAGIRRRSGEPYIMHPLAVARIVVKEIGLGSTSICAALLHDVVEDTDYTVEDIEKNFGSKIASIVDGLTKISGGVFGEQASMQAENFRKLILTMSEDIRVILIKIADRLHNMRTLQAQPLEKQYKIAGETQYIYAPLAHRLGLFSIKTELEDLSFKYEHPELYDEIEAKLAADKNARLATFEEFVNPIRKKLTSMGYEFELQARIKSVYSIWKKMTTKNIPFEEVYDLLAVRIIFKPNPDMSEKDQCWIIYSALTEFYKPHPERIRDWISTPKANGYEALHVTVMGQDGEWIEVQIRTERMHEIAEKGLAAHWKYKTGVADDETELDKWIGTIQELLQHPEPNAVDFLDTFKLTLFAEEVFVFTPQGEIKTMPQGATALDFAFMLHSDLGKHCIGAKVNHKLEPLSYILQGGDQVEVLTSHTQEPQLEWLEWATTARAQEYLKKLFRKEGLLPRETQKKQPKKTSWNPLKLLTGRSKHITITDETIGSEYHLASCCHPIPGDDVLGYMDESGTIIIHRRDCPEADKLKANYGKSLYSASWQTAGTHVFPATIQIEGIDKVGMVIEILHVVSEEHKLNIHDIHFTSKDGIFIGTLEVLTHDVAELNRVCKALQQLTEVNLAQHIN